MSRVNKGSEVEIKTREVLAFKHVLPKLGNHPFDYDSLPELKPFDLT